MNLTFFTALLDCIKNELHYMHFYCCGPMFDRYHKILDDYYTKLQDQYDEFAELCIQNKLDVIHPNDSASIGYKSNITDAENFDYKNTPEAINTLFNLLLNSAHDVLKLYEGNENTGTRTVIENFIQYWEKEIYYKNARRMI